MPDRESFYYSRNMSSGQHKTTATEDKDFFMLGNLRYLVAIATFIASL